MVGVRVEDYYNAPFIQLWLSDSCFKEYYASPALSRAEQNRKKLILARWALCQVLAAELNDIDSAVRVKPHLFIPQLDKDSKIFNSGKGST